MSVTAYVNMNAANDISQCLCCISQYSHTWTWHEYFWPNEFMFFFFNVLKGFNTHTPREEPCQAAECRIWLSLQHQLVSFSYYDMTRMRMCLCGRSGALVRSLTGSGSIVSDPQCDWELEGLHRSVCQQVSRITEWWSKFSRSPPLLSSIHRHHNPFPLS